MFTFSLQKVVFTIFFTLITLQLPQISAQSSVRSGIKLCQDETNAIQKRLPLVKKSLEKILDTKLTTDIVPTIGLASSGGGCRAMIAHLGFIAGLEEIGLLDCSMYTALLSGSTWAEAGLLSHNFDINRTVNHIQGKVAQKAINHLQNWKPKISALLQKSPTTAYGDFVGDIVLPEKNYLLSSFAPIIQTGTVPLPIFTAIHADHKPYEWAEFSPFEVGSTYLQAWIKTTDLNKEFNNGTSTATVSAEPLLSTLLGMFGSAYSINQNDAVRKILHYTSKNFLNNQSIQDPSTEPQNVNQRRIVQPDIGNFCYNMPNTAVTDLKKLNIVDAGIDFNIPIPPLLRRGVDLIIICDASCNQHIELFEAQRYAQRKGYKFPPIDYTNITSNKVSLFYDPQDPSVPVIIYFPHQVMCPTTKFYFTHQEFENHFLSMKNAIVESRETILQGLKIAVENKKASLKK